MRRTTIIALTATLLLAICSCEDPKRQNIPDFVKDGTVRLCSEGTTRFLYDPLTCQMEFNRKKCEFTVCIDDMSDFFQLTLNAIPTTVNQTVIGDVIWTGSATMEQRKDVALQAVKLEGDKIWLWNEGLDLAIVVRVLE